MSDDLQQHLVGPACGSTTIASKPRATLRADHWAEAALDAIAGGGIEAVAVEPLARTLGVTKGSFYWHYANRDALVTRALETWERQETVDMLGRAEQEPSAQERIHTLLKSAANTDARRERILLALSGSKHVAARCSVQRVTEAWRQYLETCYSALGMNSSEARYWATFAYSTYVGTIRMRRDNPDALPEGQDYNDYLRFLIRTLIPVTTSSVSNQD